MRTRVQRERGSAPGCPGERAPRSLCSQGRPRGPMARPRGPPGATCHPSSCRVRPPPGSPSAPGWTGALGPQRVLRRCSVFTSFPLFCNLLWAYLSFAPLLSGRRVTSALRGVLVEKGDLHARGPVPAYACSSRSSRSLHSQLGLRVASKAQRRPGIISVFLLHTLCVCVRVCMHARVLSFWGKY